MKKLILSGTKLDELTAFQLCAGHPLIAGLGDDSENVRALFIARQGITEEFSVKKC